MTEREAAAFGFLYRCAQEGLDEARTRERVKRAFDWLEVLKSLGSAAGALPGAASHLGVMGGIASLGTGLALGGMGGYAAGKALDPRYDADDIRRQELISAYDSAADDMEEDLRARKELASR